jgi:hypothetical protein
MVSTPSERSVDRPRGGTQSMPMANPGGGMFTVTNIFSTRAPALDVSPTPHRFSSLSLKSSKDADLTTTILELLRSNNVKLSTSAEVHLRHTINLKVGVYETELQQFEETVSELHAKIDELEGNHTDARP